ncbi:hypothetical protein ACFQJC_12665 [Haloferax namakaokahaiae]|uniref:Uncharacterized protein n=1 Tax=Haloferax namakaokahaiae TaxID=1748331 RepID=A0ABD5ZH55_9EURY
MFDAPIESLSLWTALALGGVVLLGVVGGLSSPPAPDAPAVADAIDRVAVAEYDASATVHLDAESVRLGTHRIALRNDGGTSHATFAFGPVTPATPGTPLAAVARGSSPESVFDTPAAFESALADARTTNASWHAAEESLVVRRISWEGVDALVVVA